MVKEEKRPMETKEDKKREKKQQISEGKRQKGTGKKRKWKKNQKIERTQQDKKNELEIANRRGIKN